MKIRNGFVSNSSSSSFIVLTTPENLDKIKASSSDAFKEFLDVVLSGRRKIAKVHGVELVDLSRVIHDSYIDRWDDEERGRGDITGLDLWMQLMGEIKEGGGYVTEECCG